MIQKTFGRNVGLRNCVSWDAGACPGNLTGIFKAMLNQVKIKVTKYRK
jgi:hypothetical protein